MERYYEGKWVEDPSRRGLIYCKPGFYDPAKEVPEEKLGPFLSHTEMNQLIDFLFKAGYIKPQLGENREEDTKIIHRLIDVLEKK